MGISTIFKWESAAEYVYNNYLSRPYENEESVEPYLECEDFPRVERPNHGLVHTLRTASYVPRVVKIYNSLNVKALLSIREIEELQLAMLFFVAGRESELSFDPDDKKKNKEYNAYRKASAKAFSKYVKEELTDRISNETRKMYKQLIFNPYDPKLINTDLSKVIRICHDLDLRRCYGKKKYDRKLEEIAKLFSRGKAKEEQPKKIQRLFIELSKDVKKCIKNTGDRDLVRNREYSSHFFIYSHDVVRCVEVISKCFHFVGPSPIPKQLNEYFVNPSVPWEFSLELTNRLIHEITPKCPDDLVAKITKIVRGLSKSVDLSLLNSLNLFRNGKTPEKEVVKQMVSISSQFEENKPKVKIRKADPEFEIIMRYYLQHQPDNRRIKKISCTFNPVLLSQFKGHLKTCQSQAERTKFKPKLPTEEGQKEKEARGCVLKRFREMTQQFKKVKIDNHKLGEKVNVLPLWTGTTKEALKDISHDNFFSFGTGPERTDSGFFGSGIYLTNSAKYAAKYGEVLIFAFASMREPYPVISDTPIPIKPKDMEEFKGKSLRTNYDAHFIPIQSISPNDPEEMKYHPCQIDDIPEFEEIVVKESSQVYPVFSIKFVKYQEKKQIIQSYKINNAEDESHQHYYNSFYAIEKLEKFKKRLSMLRTDAEESDVHAQHTLGKYYIEINNERKAKKWFTCAADQGSIESMYNLLLLKDVSYLKILKKNCVDECARSTFYLALYYRNFLGKEKETNIYLENLKDWADENSAESAYYLALFYKILEDDSSAKKWRNCLRNLNRDQHDLSAAYYLVLLYTHSHPHAEYCKRYVKKLKEASKEGYAQAAFYLGLYYYQPNSQQKSTGYFCKAAELGCQQARIRLNLN